MQIKTASPRSWLDLIDELYDGDWDPTISRFRAKYAYRGVVDADWDMKTSLMRLSGPYDTLEHHLIRNFRKYAHRDVVDRDSFWYWLSVAQHHGLPTRLLDWTYSPFVALHFATDDLGKMKEPGAIWVVEVPSAHQSLPNRLKRMLSREGAAVFTVDMLVDLERRPAQSYRDPTSATEPNKTQSVRNLDEFDKLADRDFALFFEPPSIDDRIVNQFALFSVLSNPRLTMDSWLRESQANYKKVMIPPELKWQVRDKLDQANITERVIYPGLDGLSRWLKRHYSSSI